MPIHSLPAQITPFIGRETELAEIVDLLAAPTCRLLTLTGPGGIGKTRLALEAARTYEVGGAFTNGVYFVPLQPVNTPDFIVPAIADAVQFSFKGDHDTKKQLLRYLGDKCLLLVMDNFEHLLDGTDLLPELLNNVLGLKLLLTSRERLHLNEEWVLDIRGLPFPSNHAEISLLDHFAVQLFTQSARRTGFAAQTADLPSVARICQLVEGNPLAIELAAAWSRIMPCGQIADEIAHSFDILTTTLRNTSEKHRSMRATFEYSWKLLIAVEQTVFRQLAVFRGGFTREAAETVAGASLLMLAALADKSLLRVDANGRYDLHELLRQFAADKLAEAGETGATAQKHLEYFMALAEAGESHTYGREQAVWYDRQDVEMDNFRAAFVWSLSSGEIELGLRMAAALRWVWEMRSHPIEGADWFKKLLAVNQEMSPTVRAKALHRACEVISFTGEVVQARLWGEEAVRFSRALNDPWNIAWSLSALGFVSYRDQHLSEAAVLLDESIPLFRELDDPLGMSHALRRRAVVASYQRDYAYGQSLVEESLTHDRAAQDQNATAWGLVLLGTILWHRHRNPAPVVVACQESIALFQEIQDVGGMSFPLITLANVERSQGNFERAGALYQEALRIDRQLDLFGKGDIEALIGIGCLEAVQGKAERAVRLFGATHDVYISRDYLTGFFPIDPFDEEIDALRVRLGEQKFNSTWSEGQAMTIKQAVAYALEDETPPTEMVAIQPLINLLTERELEILRLVADGLNSREIAQSLVLSVGTIRWYVKQIYSKLDAHSRAQALARAREMYLLV